MEISSTFIHGLHRISIKIHQKLICISIRIETSIPLSRVRLFIRNTSLIALKITDNRIFQVLSREIARLPSHDQKL